MGRIAKPAAVKEAQGNPGRRRIAKEGPAAPASQIAAPKSLSAAQRRLWEAIAPELAAMRILRPSDLSAFGRYIVLLEKWQRVAKELKNAELVTVTISAHVTMERRSQWLMLALMLDKRLGEIEDRFGMNPAARQRLMLQMAQQGALPIDAGRKQEEAPAAQPGGAADEPPLPLEASDLPKSPVGLLN